MNAFFFLTLAVAVSMLIIPLAWRLAPHLGMVDMPDPRKVHKAPVPRVGGWGIAIGMLAPLVLSFEFNPLLQSFVIGAVVLFFFGLWDDAKQSGHWVKFVGQIGAAAAVVYHGGLYVSHIPFLDAPLDPALGQPFTVFALVGMINAINHSDGLDGLAGGESMLTLIAIAFLGYLVDSTLTVGIALAAMGGILGFLRYNTHPARVFMGDAGSQVLGFTLGFLAVYLTQVAHPALSPALPLLLLGLPISDILAVLFQRIKGGMNWFRATRNHVHHRLLDLGFDHYETVVIIYSIQAALVLAAVPLRYQSDALVAFTYFAVVGGLFVALILAERSGWRMRRKGEGGSRLTAALQGIRANHVLRATPLALISILVPLLVVVAAVWAREIPRDFGLTSAVLAGVVLIAMLARESFGAMLLRAAIYVTATFAVYLALNFPRDEGMFAAQSIDVFAVAAMALLAIAIAVFVRFTAERKFGTTPTDYLIVFGVLALVAFGNTDIQARTTVLLVVYATILLYGCEVIIGRISSRWSPLYVASLCALSVMALRGLLAL